MRQVLRTIAVLTMSALLSACGLASGGGDDTTAAIVGTSAYILSPGDKLKIKVFGEPDLSGEFQIDEAGKIAFPLVGEIRASGSTLEEFRLSLVENLTKGYLRQPRVTADILNYQPINIIGEVRNAGQYPYRPGISAQDIAAIAGGYTYRADQGTLYIKRDRNGDPITVSVNEGHYSIMPGDTIRIPERFF